MNPETFNSVLTLVGTSWSVKKSLEYLGVSKNVFYKKLTDTQRLQLSQAKATKTKINLFDADATLNPEY